MGGQSCGPGRTAAAQCSNPLLHLKLYLGCGIILKFGTPRCRLRWGSSITIGKILTLLEARISEEEENPPPEKGGENRRQQQKRGSLLFPLPETATSSCALTALALRHNGKGRSEWMWPYQALGNQGRLLIWQNEYDSTYDLNYMV